MALDNTLPWGWTWARLESLADRCAHVHQRRGDRVLPWQDIRDAAMDGIVMALAEATLAAPAEEDLFRAGAAQISAEQADYASRHGIPSGNLKGSRHAAYWGPGNHQNDPYERLDELLTLRQVWPLVGEKDQTVIAELGYWLDHRLAAASLGYTWAGWRSAISRARRNIKVVWFAPDSPPRHYMHDSGPLDGSRQGIGRRISTRRSQRHRKQRSHAA